MKLLAKQFLGSKRKAVKEFLSARNSKAVNRPIVSVEATTSRVTKCIIKAFYCLWEDELRNFTRSRSSSSLETQDIRATFSFLSRLNRIRIKLQPPLSRNKKTSHLISRLDLTHLLINVQLFPSLN